MVFAEEATHFFVLILQHVMQKGWEINVETLRPTLIETWNLPDLCKLYKIRFQLDRMHFFSITKTIS
jgi:hypothetical protein